MDDLDRVTPLLPPRRRYMGRLWNSRRQFFLHTRRLRGDFVEGVKGVASTDRLAPLAEVCYLAATICSDLPGVLGVYGLHDGVRYRCAGQEHQLVADRIRVDHDAGMVSDLFQAVNLELQLAALVRKRHGNFLATRRGHVLLGGDVLAQWPDVDLDDDSCRLLALGFSILGEIPAVWLERRQPLELLAGILRGSSDRLCCTAACSRWRPGQCMVCQHNRVDACRHVPLSACGTVVPRRVLVQGSLGEENRGLDSGVLHPVARFGRGRRSIIKGVGGASAPFAWSVGLSLLRVPSTSV
mmetsp:Transcript_109917/g.354544  ORF Transcript_109917/g.354544 Transcript_109917/m.354544 type:complete len:297 (-) Transcript_109917:349-1239(-)